MLYRSLLNLLWLNESLDGVLGFGCGVNGLERLALEFRARLFGTGSEFDDRCPRHTPPLVLVAGRWEADPFFAVGMPVPRAIVQHEPAVDVIIGSHRLAARRFA